MSEPTPDTVVSALARLAGHLPIAALQVREDELTSTQLHALGAELTQLGELVHRHADTRSEPADQIRRRSLWSPQAPGGSCLPPP
ncbi:hypothetical protein [Amycolatopsis sp. GM8]|uniref:hypothetical protein n=1 Tax=Amycolatopsis sp. GM8 TaxID=2896530 RepID=UPI001F262F6E|nr:hypothetical protein [Amycolatopsis sp. GM8]